MDETWSNPRINQKLKNMTRLKEMEYSRGIRYETEDAVMSLIYPCDNTSNRFEIVCLEGDLIEDFERFSSLEEAENRVYYLLFNY